MQNRLDHRLTKLETQRDGGYRLVVVADDETEDEARTRAGLDDWPGPVIFLSETDANL